jgi:hypothetical protein
MPVPAGGAFGHGGNWVGSVRRYGHFPLRARSVVD